MLNEFAIAVTDPVLGWMTRLPNIFPAILSGGSGSRLWPVSRSTYPKQFLTLNGSRSLLQQTLLRVGDPDMFHRPMVIANNDYRFLVAEQVQEIGVEPLSIVLEPGSNQLWSRWHLRRNSYQSKNRDRR